MTCLSCHRVEEADTRMILHSLHAARLGHEVASIRTVDTDVVVLAAVVHFKALGLQKLPSKTSPQPSISEEDIANIERYIVILYDRTSECLGVDQARKTMFMTQTKPMDRLPPSSDALLQHISSGVHSKLGMYGAKVL